MIIGPDPIEVAPSEPYSENGRDPNRGVVTLREFGERMFERTVTFPDGSAQVTIIGDTSETKWKKPDDNGDAPIGAAAGASLLAEAAAGTLVYCHAAASWFAFDGAVWRRDRGDSVARRLRAALRDAGFLDPSSRMRKPSPGRSRRSRRRPTGRSRMQVGTPTSGASARPAAQSTSRPACCTRPIRPTASPAPRRSPRPRHRTARSGGASSPRRRAATRRSKLSCSASSATRSPARHRNMRCSTASARAATARASSSTPCAASLAITPPSPRAQGAERRAGKAHSTEIAMLAGARLVTASETEEGRVWADGRLKLLTGGDPVTARFLGRDHFTFTPRFKLIVVGNHRPVLRTIDAALRRRLCVVPFVTQPSVPDRTLEARLKAEWPGILRWMIEGCLAWREERAHGGLARPASVTTATDAYLGSQDIVGQFLAEWCERGARHLETAAQLYAAWRLYARNMGEEPGTQRRFAARLDRHGLTRERLRYARVYRGIRLRFRGEIEGEVEKARREVV